MPNQRIDRSDWYELVMKPWMDGKPQYVIAREIGVDKANICTWLKRHATPAHREAREKRLGVMACRYFSCARRMRRAEPIIRKAVKEGKNSYDIAPLLGIHASTVRTYMERLGIRDKQRVPLRGVKRTVEPAATAPQPDPLIPAGLAEQVRLSLARLGIQQPPKKNK